MKTTYVWGGNDWFVYLFAENFADFRNKVRELRHQWDLGTRFSDIESILLFIYDDTEREIDYGMDGQLYVENKFTWELCQKDLLEAWYNDICCIPLDKKEIFYTLNPSYKGKLLSNKQRENVKDWD